VSFHGNLQRVAFFVKVNLPVNRSTAKGEGSPETKPVRGRLVEIGLGVLFILIAVAATRVWVELKNARRADSPALRQSVALTLEAASRYGLDEPEAHEAWSQFLNRPPGQKVPTRPAHEFLDSFMIKYQDGVLDSTESSALYHRLAEFPPEID